MSQALIRLPAKVSKRTGTAEQTLQTKADLLEIFTTYFKSQPFSVLPATRRAEIIDLFTGLNQVVDLSYVAQVEEKARTTNTLK